MTLLYGNTMHWTGTWDCFPCRAEDSEAEKGSQWVAQEPETSSGGAGTSGAPHGVCWEGIGRGSMISKSPPSLPRYCHLYSCPVRVFTGTDSAFQTSLSRVLPICRTTGASRMHPPPAPFSSGSLNSKCQEWVFQTPSQMPRETDIYQGWLWAFPLRCWDLQSRCVPSHSSELCISPPLTRGTRVCLGFHCPALTLRKKQPSGSARWVRELVRDHNGRVHVQILLSRGAEVNRPSTFVFDLRRAFED